MEEDPYLSLRLHFWEKQEGIFQSFNFMMEIY